MEMDINNAAVLGTKWSPYFLNYGFHPAIHPELPLPKEPPVESVKGFAERLRTTQEEAVARFEQAKENQAHQYNLRHQRPERFQVTQSRSDGARTGKLW